MGTRIDLTGQRFGEWEVIGFSHSIKRRYFWDCRCSCGAEKKVVSLLLKQGKSTRCRTCGSKKGYRSRENYHGMSDHPNHALWLSMRQRCNNPNNADFPNYGGRGISVSERWNWFPNFVEDMGERPEGMSLDREDNDGNYEPDNCRWATDKEQANNRRKRAVK